MSPATEARRRNDRSHHRVVQTLSALASEFTDLAGAYDGHVGVGEAIAQQSLLRDAATLRCVAALVIRGNYNLPTARLWIDASTARLDRVYTALRGHR